MNKQTTKPVPQWIKDMWLNEENKQIILSTPKGFWDNARIREMIHDHVMVIGWSKMITEEEFLNKVSELMDKTKKDALESAKSVFNSGAIDKEDFENTYLLPKIFLIAYATRLKYQWSPLSAYPNHKKTVRNIEKFIWGGKNEEKNRYLIWWKIYHSY